jgi:threonine/homoserine/homoserine lactone efflux protein
MAVAWGLWSKAGEALSGSGFGTCRVFAATLLNPKALLFAAVIFPETAFETSAAFLQAISIFAAVIVPIALAWIGFGSVLSQPGFFIRPQTIQRSAALILLTFSATLGAAALG